MTGRPADPRPGLDADLATLREFVGTHDDPYDGDTSGVFALRRVEAEIARLESRLYVLEKTLPENYIETLGAAEAKVARLRDGLREASERLGELTRPPWLENTPLIADVRDRLRALLAEDEAVRGEYHAEGLDERGIYGGKSHEPIEERPVDRRHPDYADDPWLAEDTPKGGAA